MELYPIYPWRFLLVDCVILGYQDEEAFLLYPNNFELTRGAGQWYGIFIDENDPTEQETDQILIRTTGPE